jgi:hypothetical protein
MMATAGAMIIHNHMNILHPSASVGFDDTRNDQRNPSILRRSRIEIATSAHFLSAVRYIRRRACASITKKRGARQQVDSKMHDNALIDSFAEAVWEQL